MTFEIHGLEMGGNVTSWKGVWVCDEYMKDRVSECVSKCVNECVNECERGLWVRGWQMDIKIRSRGREEFEIRMI